MNKEKIMSFIKGKQFYFVLLLCFIAVFSIATIVISNGNKDKSKENIDLVDLNTPLDEDDDEGNILIDPVASDDIEDDLVPASTLPEKDSIISEDILAERTNEAKEDDNIETIPTISDAVNVVQKDPTETVLTFNEANGLAWPVQGDILLPYSMENFIYFETLDQYMVNPAVAIKAMVGNDVQVAAKGVVEDISKSVETGTTITVDHGSGYKTVYGQLKDLSVKVGDKLEKGDKIGVIDQPTMYYVKEGSHLYFKVLKDGKTINPESLLQ